MTRIPRRQFLKTAGSAAAIGITAAGAAPGVSLVIDPADNIASTAPVQWAARELEQSLSGQIHRCERVADARPGDLCILAAGSNSPTAKEVLKRAGVSIADAPQALGLVPDKVSGKSVLLACGSDSLGLVYGLLDLADRVHHGAGSAALQIGKAITEQELREDSARVAAGSVT